MHLMSTAFHPEKDCPSDNFNKMVVQFLCSFASDNRANWDDYHHLVMFAYISSVNRSTKLTPFELDLGYELPLPLDLLSGLLRPQANESAKALQCRNFVK